MPNAALEALISGSSFKFLELSYKNLKLLFNPNTHGHCGLTQDI